MTMTTKTLISATVVEEDACTVCGLYPDEAPTQPTIEVRYGKASSQSVFRLCRSCASQMQLVIERAVDEMA